jgi:hypothetical protein
LDRELPIEKCRSSVTLWGEEIVSTDDPRWIECERAVLRRMDEETDAACTLINVLPTTMAGLVSLLQYAVDGEGWPTSLESESGKNQSWRQLLIANLAEVLPELAGRMA